MGLDYCTTSGNPSASASSRPLCRNCSTIADCDGSCIDRSPTTRLYRAHDYRRPTACAESLGEALRPFSEVLDGLRLELRLLRHEECAAAMRLDPEAPR